MHPDHLFQVPETPAFIIDLSEVRRILDLAEELRRDTGCQVLYSIKPLPLPPLLEMMAPSLAGFAVSSVFEAKLARGALAGGGGIHFTSPGIRPGEVANLASLCDYVSFNSMGQWQKYNAVFGPTTTLGLRVNPGISFLDDERYDPCRPFSKLGVPLQQLRGNAALAADGLEGLLVHTNCESTNFGELEQTVDAICDQVPELLKRVSWLNLGGGYLFPAGIDLGPLKGLVGTLQREFGFDFILEPGAAFVRSAGCLVATVLDVMDSGGRRIAVLDATVNHMPELLEFDYEPDVLGHADDGEYEYILAGCTCLAGDVFGEYRFRQPLREGDRVVFLNAGSYSLVKAHCFNGVNLPDVYFLGEQGGLDLVRRFTFEDYAARWNASVRFPV